MQPAQERCYFVQYGHEDCCGILNVSKPRCLACDVNGGDTLSYYKIWQDCCRQESLARD